jgi:predicted membrane protein
MIPVVGLVIVGLILSAIAGVVLYAFAGSVVGLLLAVLVHTWTSSGLR